MDKLIYKIQKYQNILFENENHFIHFIFTLFIFTIYILVN